MRCQNIRTDAPTQVEAHRDRVPIDLHAERMIVGACLVCGSRAPLQRLRPDQFFCEWNRVIVRAILNFPATGFTASQLAATLPAFARPYMSALMEYQILVVLGERESN